MAPRTLLLLLIHALASGAQQTVGVNVTVDCASTVAPLLHFWRSCGYSPSQMALRADGVENTARIGAAPRRAIAQVRIHFLLDLLIVTGFWGNASTPSGFALSYDFTLLDFAFDTLVANRLSPGFELMGSPSGFPTLPVSFYSPWNNNFRVEPNQTLCMFRALVSDTLVHYIRRYGPEEVAQWNVMSWNEPSVGWGWPPLNDTADAAFTGFTLAFDAMGAGVEDAEAATGASLRFGGLEDSRQPSASTVTQWLFPHVETGRNAWTGARVRLDFLSLHFKGKGTSSLVAQQALTAFTWMRGPGNVGPRIASTPFFNDEADPLVGWLDPEPWRADARYGAIIPKVIAQHLLQIVDNRTGNNPLGLISNDNGFLNLDGPGTNGFSMRTLMARFTDLATGRYALVRKMGFSVMAMLSKLGEVRVASSGPGAPGGDGIAASMTGVIASVTPASALAPVQAAVLVYNSNDTSTSDGGDNGTVPVSITLVNTPFTPGEVVMLVHYRLDNEHGNAYAVWTAQGSPDVPSTETLLAMWAADSLAPLAPPTAVTIPPSGQPLILPLFHLPLPGISLLHLAARPAGNATPAVPSGLRAYVKSSSLSLLDPGVYSEVLVRWDCDAPRGGAGVNATVPSPLIFGYAVQVSTSGGGEGPWETVQAAESGDMTCSFLHAAPVSSGAPPSSLFYRIAASDYWGSASEWTGGVQAGPWPTIA